MKKVVISVVGKDTTGIIHKTTGVLYRHNVNVLDITQTTMQDLFTMMMLTDIGDSRVPFDELVADLDALGEAEGLIIHCQHEDIFNSMHTI